MKCWLRTSCLRSHCGGTVYRVLLLALALVRTMASLVCFDAPIKHFASTQMYRWIVLICFVFLPWISRRQPPSLFSVVFVRNTPLVPNFCFKRKNKCAKSLAIFDTTITVCCVRASTIIGTVPFLVAWTVHSLDPTTTRK